MAVPHGDAPRGMSVSDSRIAKESSEVLLSLFASPPVVGGECLKGHGDDGSPRTSMSDNGSSQIVQARARFT